MKLTQEQVLAALKAVGLADVEIVEAAADSDFAEDAFIDAIDNARGSILKPKYKEELESEAKKTIAGKTRYDIIKTVRDITGIERKTLEGIEDINEIIKLAVDHTKTLTEGGKDEVRKEIDEMLERHRTELEAKDHEWNTKYSELDTKYKDRDIVSFLKGKLKDAPLMQTADKDILAADFKKHLADKYHLSYDEAQAAVNLYKKDNPQMPALDGNKHIDILKEAQDFFMPRGQWVTDMRHAKPDLTQGNEFKVSQPAPNHTGDVNTLNDQMSKFLESKVPA